MIFHSSVSLPEARVGTLTGKVFRVIFVCGIFPTNMVISWNFVKKFSEVSRK